MAQAVLLVGGIALRARRAAPLLGLRPCRCGGRVEQVELLPGLEQGFAPAEFVRRHAACAGRVIKEHAGCQQEQLPAHTRSLGRWCVTDGLQADA